MEKGLSCKLCGSKNTCIVNTYKHKWVCCNECNSASRKRKNRYLISFAPQLLLRKKPGLRRLLADSDVLQDNSIIYDYMAAESHTEIHKREKVFEKFFQATISKYNLQIEGKKILDISGGNGSFVKRFEDLGAEVAMTEFNQKSVDYARSHFNIRAERFGFNSDHIDSLFNDSFDLVFLRAAIMFCLRPSRFIEDLKKITHEDTLIIVYDSVLPTIGSFLRWQFDDYTYLILYDAEKLIELFETQGCKLIAHDELASYPYNLGRGVLEKLMGYRYEITALVKYKNRDRVQKSVSLIFQVTN